MASLSERELAYLDTQRLGRLDALAPDGYPQNNAVGFFYTTELGTIDIGGHKLGDSRKFSNVRTHPKATLVVDDLASMRTDLAQRQRPDQSPGVSPGGPDVAQPEPHAHCSGADRDATGSTPPAAPDRLTAGQSAAASPD
jgi:PPOX class F420-dependent enzyme/OxyR family protein